MPIVRAGMKQVATAQESKLIPVSLKLVDEKGGPATGGLMAAYANLAGSMHPGSGIVSHRWALLYKQGECTMLLPVGSTWTFHHGPLLALTLRGHPTLKAIRVGAGTRLIELQRTR